MKKILILMLGLVAGTASFAQSTNSQTPQPSVQLAGSNRLLVTIGPESAVATISLRDPIGHVLYSQNMQLDKGLSQYFNIAALDTGTYQLAIAIGKETVVKTFVIEEKPAQKMVALRS